MPRRCCVPSCMSNSGRNRSYTSVFRFPTTESQLNTWVQNIGRVCDGFVRKQQSSVCIKHFENKYIITEDSCLKDDGTYLTVARKYPKLSDDAVPTIFKHERRVKRGAKKREQKKTEERLEEEETGTTEQNSAQMTASATSHPSSLLPKTTIDVLQVSSGVSTLGKLQNQNSTENIHTNDLYLIPSELQSPFRKKTMPKEDNTRVYIIKKEIFEPGPRLILDDNYNEECIKNDIQEDCIKFEQEEIDLKSSVDVNIKHKENETNLADESDQGHTNDGDDVMEFFVSMAHIVQSFPPELRGRVKRTVFDIISDCKPKKWA